MLHGAVTSRDLVAMYLARIAAYDQQGPALNAISVINPNALAQADALDAERRATGPRGPLHGIPVIVKDNYDTAGMQTAGGSVLLKGWDPGADATLVAKLRDAGAIIIAKSNMHEWAWSWETYGSLFGQTRNPYALDRVPGGSSGGTGAAIAANFAAAGMGSDTRGSIRVPSAHNSLAGLRPTQGLISRAGIIPLSHTQDTGGPMGRTVTDLAIVMDAIAGYDPADPTTATAVGRTPPSYTSYLQADGLRGARIGLLTNLLGTDPEDAEVAAVIRAAAEEMRGRGAEVVEVTIDGLAALADNRVDVLLYPTVRRKAARIGEGTQMGVNRGLSAHSGLPAITVPAGFTPDGLPVGVELLGRAWSEGDLLRLAYAFEQATHHRRPPASTPAIGASRE